jgi:hypothetical protein
VIPVRRCRLAARKHGLHHGVRKSFRFQSRENQERSRLVPHLEQRLIGGIVHGSAVNWSINLSFLCELVLIVRVMFAVAGFFLPSGLNGLPRAPRPTGGKWACEAVGQGLDHPAASGMPRSLRQGFFLDNPSNSTPIEGFVSKTKLDTSWTGWTDWTDSGPPRVRPGPAPPDLSKLSKPF